MGLHYRMRHALSSAPRGEKNSIADVPGILVGHTTLAYGAEQTGVTAILPHNGNIFYEKVVASSHVINGFAKSTGLVQIQEMGTIETPILLSNTLSVGQVSTALVQHMLAENSAIGDTTSTVNPVVLECNDGYLNDIRALSISSDDVKNAIATASDVVAEGSVGAGRGMCCYGLKGGIGTSSRAISIEGAPADECYHIGALVLSNFGSLHDLCFDGWPIGPDLAVALSSQRQQAEQGSIIVILATDIPLSERQLGRMARRAGVGVNRTGSFCANGSGEVVIAFSTAERRTQDPPALVVPSLRTQEGAMDPIFRATVDVVEEAILSSLLHSPSVIGRKQRKQYSLHDALQFAIHNHSAPILEEFHDVLLTEEPQLDKITASKKTSDC